MRSYLACGGFETADYAGRIADIFREGRIVGRGRATEAAAIRLIRGVPWQEAGTPPPSAGNGSAMRAGPIGLFFFDDPARLVSAACDQGKITHSDPRCQAGAVAIAGAVALAMRGEPIEPSCFLSTLRGWAEPVDSSLAAALSRLDEWVLLPPERAAAPISRAGLDSPDPDGWEGISPFVTGSVLWSLYSFLRAPDDYWETICTAIAVGGDVDTTAAMAGAISGARVGLEKIPSDLARRLNDQGSWGFRDLVELSRACYDLTMRLRSSVGADRAL